MLSNLPSGKMSLPMTGELELDDLQDSFQLKPFCDSMCSQWCSHLMTISTPKTEDCIPHSSAFTTVPVLGQLLWTALLLTLPGSCPQPCLLPAGLGTTSLRCWGASWAGEFSPCRMKCSPCLPSPMVALAFSQLGAGSGLPDIYLPSHAVPAFFSTEQG